MWLDARPRIAFIDDGSSVTSPVAVDTASTQRPQLMRAAAAPLIASDIGTTCYGNGSDSP